MVSAVNTSSYRDVEPVQAGLGAASYNKLPNPLAHIIQQLPVVDGLEADKLLPFFRTVFQLVDYPGMSESTVLELIFPYCRGTMADRVAEVMRRKGGVAEFHRVVLRTFVPGRLMEQLRHRHFYRVQARGETCLLYTSTVNW